MPTYTIQAPNGKTLSVEGDHVPTEAELQQIFKAAGVETGTAVTPLPDSHDAHIGPLPSTARVTVGDLQDDPVGAMKRMGTILGKDATDPKLWLGLAAAYFGPKVFEAIAPGVGELAAQAGKGVSAVGRGAEALGKSGPVRAAGALGPVEAIVRGDLKGVALAATPPALEYGGRGLQRVGEAMQDLKPAAVPQTPVEAPSPPPQAPIAAPATPEPPVTETAPSAKLQPGEGDTYIQLRKAGKSNTEALKQIIADRQAPPARISLTADETKAYLQLRNAGKSDQQAKEAIVAMRTLSKNLPSSAQVREAVKDRNATGRWEGAQP